MLENPQTAIPAIAKDERLLASGSVGRRGDPHDALAASRRRASHVGVAARLRASRSDVTALLDAEGYRDTDGQLGNVDDYDEFLAGLDSVWRHCFGALVPGGRLICVVGDVCLSRRKNKGRHTVVPLHASIQEHCRAIGFDNLAPIIWHKIANAVHEVANGSAFLGKPYEPNAVIKNDIEFILMQRKPGGYRKPGVADAGAQRHLREQPQDGSGRSGPADGRSTRITPPRIRWNWPNG